MKRRLLYAGCLFAMLCGALGCSLFNRKLGMDDDNFVEESAEALIEEHLGVDVDLSPGSPED